MLRAEYTPTDESRHGMLIFGSTNVFVDGLTIADTGGDGIIMSGDVSGYYNTNITVRNCTIDNCTRNGIAVERVTNGLLENITITDTNGRSPETGVDIEPKAADAQVVNLTLRNVNTSGSVRGGFFCLLLNLTNASEDVSILFENCSSTGDGTGAVTGGARGSWALVTKNTTPVGGTVTINGMTIADSTIQSVLFTAKPADGPTITINDLTINNPSAGVASRPPIFYTSDALNTADLSGFIFNNLVINDAIDRDPMEYYDGSTANVNIGDITGDLTLTYTVTPTTTIYDPLTAADLHSWMADYPE
jgi:hypothetical protein